jgi:arylsulfatase
LRGEVKTPEVGNLRFLEDLGGLHMWRREMERPNVVFIIADQHRWDFVGEGGHGRTYTPALDRLGRAGTRFRSAYCTSPLCCPSRAAIASGRYGMNSGCFTNLHELPPGTPSYVSQFRQSGYHTCAIGKTHMEIHAYDSDLTGEAHRAYMDSLGWDEICEISGNGMLKTGIRCAYSEYLRETGHFEEVLRFYQNWHYFMDRDRKGDPDFVPHEWPFAPEVQETAFVGQRAIEWLRQWEGNGPFFLHVGFAAPHAPPAVGGGGSSRVATRGETRLPGHDQPGRCLRGADRGVPGRAGAA